MTVSLSIDTAANFCAVALNGSQNGKLLFETSRDVGTGHAEILMDTIETCMKNAGCTYQDVTRVVSSIGPGSFTGVRVGLSCARAIALALSVPVIGISNLQACAAHAFSLLEYNNGNVATILDARRGEVYFQIFNKDGPLDSAKVVNIDQLVENNELLLSDCQMVCGSGAEKYLEIIKNTPGNFDLNIIHTLATAPIGIFAHLGRFASPTPIRPHPLYLRDADAKIQSGFAVSRTQDGGISR